jgi:inorganic pyrophosphatase
MGFPNQYMGNKFDQFQDGDGDPLDSVYGHVPVSMAIELLAEHGGILHLEDGSDKAAYIARLNGAKPAITKEKAIAIVINMAKGYMRNGSVVYLNEDRFDRDEITKAIEMVESIGAEDVTL